MATVRTPEELNSPIYNYYLVFNIDPAEQDAEKIRIAIMKRLSSARGSVFERRLLELREDIIEVMVNDAVYDEHIYTYFENSGGRARELMRAKAFKLDQAAELAEDACRMNSGFSLERLDAIYNAVNGNGVYFTKEEYLAHIKYDTNKKYLESEELIRKENEEKIPFSRYESANENLYVLGFYDLFGLLSSCGMEINAESTPEQIMEANKTVFSQSKTWHNLVMKQALSNLGVIIDAVMIKRPDGARTYADYLATKDAVWDKLRKRKDVGLRALTLDEYLYLVAELVRILGISVAEAHAMLKVGARYYRVSLSETKFN